MCASSDWRQECSPVVTKALSVTHQKKEVLSAMPSPSIPSLSRMVMPWFCWWWWWWSTAAARHAITICANHKTGTLVGKAFVHGVRNTLPSDQQQVAFSKMPQCDGESLHFDLDHGSRVIRLIRDPFEAIVSGLLYHRDHERGWTRQPLDQCLVKRKNITRACLPSCTTVCRPCHTCWWVPTTINKWLQPCPSVWTDPQFEQWCHAIGSRLRAFMEAGVSSGTWSSTEPTYGGLLTLLVDVVGTPEALKLGLAIELTRFMLYEAPLWQSTNAMASTQYASQILYVCVQDTVGFRQHATLQAMYRFVPGSPEYEEEAITHIQQFLLTNKSARHKTAYDNRSSLLVMSRQLTPWLAEMSLAEAGVLAQIDIVLTNLAWFVSGYCT